MKRISLKPEIEMLPEATAFLEEMLAEAGGSIKQTFQVNIAVDEVFSNIVRYSGAFKVYLEGEMSEQEIVFRFWDDGRPYDPTTNEEPDVRVPVEERAVGGLGIFMVKKLMDEIAYEYRDGWNILTVKKYREKKREYCYRQLQEKFL